MPGFMPGIQAQETRSSWMWRKDGSANGRTNFSMRGLGVPGLQRTTALRFVLRCAHDDVLE
jgi:hypothetical protein